MTNDDKLLRFALSTEVMREKIKRPTRSDQLKSALTGSA